MYVAATMLTRNNNFEIFITTIVSSPTIWGLQHTSSFLLFILIYFNMLCLVKFIYSDKAPNFCEISTVDLPLCGNGQIYGEDFAKCFGLLRIYEH